MTQQIQRFRLGDFDCVIITDGNYAGTAERIFKHAPGEELAQVLEKHQEEADDLPAGQNCLYVDTGDNKVLVDTGIGPGVMPQTGKLIDNLALAGVQPAEIDTVFISHCHGDHIGGLTDEAGNLAFPNARHMMWSAEWAHWTDENELSKKSEWSADFARRKLGPLAGDIQLVSQEGEILPGISLVPAPGHTVGHTAVSVLSGAEQLLYLADTLLHPIHIEHPDWSAEVDHDPVQATATRKRLLPWAATGHAQVLLYHFLPFPGLGRITSDSKSYAWQPAQGLS